MDSPEFLRELFFLAVHFLASHGHAVDKTEKIFCRNRFSGTEFHSAVFPDQQYLKRPCLYPESLADILDSFFRQGLIAGPALSLFDNFQDHELTIEHRLCAGSQTLLLQLK